MSVKRITCCDVCSELIGGIIRCRKFDKLISSTDSKESCIRDIQRFIRIKKPKLLVNLNFKYLCDELEDVCENCQKMAIVALYNKFIKGKNDNE